MHSISLPLTNTRLGFHYFPDTLHFREHDLKTWIPELHALGASWLTLVAPIERAIPEFFLRSLSGEGIEPVLHFHLPLGFPNRSNPLRLLFSNYARWGVRYVALYDRPNLRASWSPTAWAQADLVERFLDLYLPLAESALEEGLIPVFPPLEPGGDYWDTAFLRAALHGMQRRGRNRLLESMILGAYAWAGNRSLNWGAGGPERWPGARPYFTPPGVQDQRGFRIFDWYLTIAQAELGRPRPMLLLKAGSRIAGPSANGLQADPGQHAQRNLSLARLITAREDSPAELPCEESSETPDDPPTHLEVVPPEVLACNFWLLAASEDNPASCDAWFQPDGSKLPVVETLHQWMTSHQAADRPTAQKSFPPILATHTAHAIAHYLLLPLYEWGVPDWYLDAVRPFIKTYHPTIGFSMSEAALAARVTVVGGVQAFPEETLEKLREAGCRVERIIGDGTVVAT